MANRDWQLLSEIMVAVGRANTDKTLPRAVGEALSQRWSATRVQLIIYYPDRAHIIDATCAKTKWSTHEESEDDQGRRRRKAPALRAHKHQTSLFLPYGLRDGEEGELVIHFASGGVPILDSEHYLHALAGIIAAGRENQNLVRRVADLSRRAYSENRELKEDIQRLLPEEHLAARSAAMKAVLERIAMVARYDTAVLLQGESGTGKEVACRAIHRRSARSGQTFLQVNCGAIPSHLVESELFGHEEGAFTGAVRRHRGLFEQSHKGALLLDEVGDLPLEAQVKLLRVLQDGVVRRLGGETEIKVDVRVLAATNKLLVDMIQQGTFREDLYYRLNVFPISIPPLRQRQDDLPVLVSQLLNRLSAKLKCEPPRVTSANLARLAGHSWPGNVRELANVLEAALIVGGGRSLQLPGDFGNAPIESGGLGTSLSVESLEASVRRSIQNALRATGGKVYGEDGAAALLALKPGTLQSKMRKLGIERGDFVNR